MRGRHPQGCDCDQTWNHAPTPEQVRTARAAEREQRATARRIGKDKCNARRLAHARRTHALDNVQGRTQQ